LKQNWSCDGEVTVEDYVVIRLEATSFSSFSYQQKRNVLDVGLELRASITASLHKFG